MDKEESVREMPGIGPTRAKSLEDAGYRTVSDLLSADFFDVIKVKGMGCKSTCSAFAYIGKDIKYQNMRLIECNGFESAVIENKEIFPWKKYKGKKEFVLQPNEFNLEKTTVWSFPDRGDWATHTPHYRGNWSPRVVRNVIERYSKPGDTVLDPMVGGGTTAVECLLTGRNSTSADINEGAIRITKNRLAMPENRANELPESEHIQYVGDTRNLNLIENNSIDLIATHPPYVNIIRYTKLIDGDLSQISDYELFFKEFRKAILEYYRVLKEGKYCAILIGDTHNKGHFVPIANRLMIEFLRNGFVLKEDIIKKEWNCESDRNLGKYANSDFLLTMHEHLYIFKKPTEQERKMYKNSSIRFFD